ncbi:MAG: transporter, partial [Roseobacter sp.]
MGLKNRLTCAVAGLFLLGQGLPALAQAQQDAAALGNQLNNPLAKLISVPFQFDYNKDLGEDDKGHSWNLKIEPVIPIRLNDDWNIISRTIVSLTTFNDVPDGTGNDFGIG